VTPSASAAIWPWPCRWPSVCARCFAAYLRCCHGSGSRVDGCKAWRAMHPHSAIIRLPRSVQQRLDAAVGAFLSPQNGRLIDFSRPPGEPALIPPDSVSWRVFKNPIALFIGGIAAVILELAEPAVRTGVWEHSSFRRDPVGRLRRTGLAAMVSVYGARSVAEPTIAGIVRMHAKVTGITPAGASYCANDPRLLTWVQATAAFGIAE